MWRRTLVVGLVLVCGCGQLVESRSQAVWNLTGHLSKEQRATNSDIYAVLVTDPCDVENEFDPIVRAWIDENAEAAADRLQELSHQEGNGRRGQSAAGRGFVFLAQQALADGDFESAARHGLKVYLSGCPHRVRLEALRVFSYAGERSKIEQQMGLIESGKQDARFRPFLREMRRALAARR